MEQQGTRNNSVDIFRLLCAIMVVAIHANPFTELNSTIGYFATQIFPRIAVPFFFAIAGYYYIKALSSGKKVFLKYIKRLLIVYSIWSAVYFAIDIFFEVIGNQFNAVSTIKSVITEFFITGSHYHMWFFPALFFAVIITTLFFRFHAIKFLAYGSLALYALGCLGCAYKNIAVQIPVLSSLVSSTHFELIRRVALMGLPFFAMGYFIYLFMEKFRKTDNKKTVAAIVAFSLAFFAEIAVVIFLDLQENILLTFALYPLLFFVIVFLLNNPLPKFSKLSRACCASANFMYYAHPLVLLLCSMVSMKTGFVISPTVTFLVAVTVTLCCGLLINKLNNRFINKLVY